MIALIIAIIVILIFTEKQKSDHSTISESLPKPLTSKEQVQAILDDVSNKYQQDSLPVKPEKWSSKELTVFLQDTKRQLPSTEQFKNLKDEHLHHTPEAITTIGIRLGKIKQQVKENEEFVPKVTEFYQDCASQIHGVTSIRALCLSNLVHLRNKTGEEIDYSLFPDKVKELAKDLEGLDF